VLCAKQNGGGALVFLLEAQVLALQMAAGRAGVHAVAAGASETGRHDGR